MDELKKYYIFDHDNTGIGKGFAVRYADAQAQIDALRAEFADALVAMDKRHEQVMDGLRKEAKLAEAQLEQARKALNSIRSGVVLMVPEPQQSAFIAIIDSALLPAEPQKGAAE